jgi:hypothetical protein
MGHYYLDDEQQPEGVYEVHEEKCLYISTPLNRTYLGTFSNPEVVIVKARELFPLKRIKGCIHCLDSAILVQKK